MNNKVKKILAGVFAVVIVGGLCTSLALNFSLNSDLKALKGDVSKISSSQNDNNKNDSSDFDEDNFNDDWFDPETGDVTYEDGDYYHENGEPIKIGDDYTLRDFDYIAQSYLKNDESLLNSDADRETLELAKKVLDEIITEDMSDYEKELAIHDWLCTEINFDDTSLAPFANSDLFADTPYGTLKYHNAVCVGYATTFRLLTTMVGLECDVVHNSDYSHTWNIIKLDDGEYYIVDVYSDQNLGTTASHSNFNLNQETYYADWDTERYPVANGTKYNYANMNKVTLESFDKLFEKVQDLMTDGGEIYFNVKDASYGDTYYVVDGITNRLNLSDNMYSNYNIEEIDDEIICSFSIEIWDNNGTIDDWTDFDDLTIDTDEMDKKLNENFGSFDIAY